MAEAQQIEEEQEEISEEEQARLAAAEQEEETGEDETSEETIALAKSMGWVDEEKFRGDKTKWVDADSFVEKGMNDLPILRERLRSQSTKINDMETDISSFKKYHEATVANEYSRALKDLQEKERATVEEGDTAEFDKIQKQKQDLAQSHARTAAVGVAPAVNPLYSSWKDKNKDWFENDNEMTVYANRMSDYIAETKPELIGQPSVECRCPGGSGNGP